MKKITDVQLSGHLDSEDGIIVEIYYEDDSEEFIGLEDLLKGYKADVAFQKSLEKVKQEIEKLNELTKVDPEDLDIPCEPIKEF